MDIDIDIVMDIGCVHCGSAFKDNFMDMPHGRPIRCPYCLSTELEFKGEAFVETDAAGEGFDGYMEERDPERKTRF